MRLRLIAAGVVGAIAVAALTVAAAPWLGAATPHPLVAAAIVAAIVAVATTALDARSHPFPRLGPANQVTVLRAMLLAMAASTLTTAAVPALAWVAVVMAALFAVLDGLDGALARRTRMASVFGARFDMETDALFILVLALLVWRHDKAGAWVLGSGLMRYAFVAAGWVLPWMAAPLRATTRGRATAVAQMVGLGMALAPTTPAAVSAPIAAITLAALTWSFAIDVRYLWQTQPQAR